MSVHINRFLSLLAALIAAWCSGPANAIISGSEPLNTVKQKSDVLIRREARLKKLNALISDPKLQAKLDVIEVDPDIRALLRRLEEATGLTLSVHADLAEHQPKFGNLKLHDEPVHRIMRRLAQTQLEDGWWEKTEPGYRLVAKSSSSAKDLADKKAQDKAAKASADFFKFHPLVLDVKLQARLTVVEKRPKLPDLLARLGEATGLKFTVADNLSYHDPELGQFQLKNTRAYSVMEIIAERDLDNGHWEKIDGGYRLEGVSRALRVPPSRFPWGWTLAALGMLVLAAGAFLIYRQRGKTAAATPTNP